MKLEQIIKIADKAYPDGMIASYHAEPNGGHCDGLAKFIATELRETYDEHSSTEAQLLRAISVLDTATTELGAVTDAVRNCYWRSRSARVSAARKRK